MALERKILLERVVNILLRQRFGSLEPQRDAPRVSSEQVDGLQRVQPVTVLEKRVLKAVLFLLLHGLDVGSRRAFFLQPLDLLQDLLCQGLDVLRRTAKLHAGRAVPGLRRRVAVADAHRVGPAELLTQDVS